MRGIVAIATALLFATAGLAEAPIQSTTDVAQRWGVPPFFNLEKPEAIKPEWARRLTGYFETRDGVALRYSVLLPNGVGPFPVIVNYSGYDPGAIGGYAYLHDDTAMSTAVDASLLERGFAVLGVNARGTGCSQGLLDFLGPTYGTDGADAVEWAAKQPWSTGAIGMANWSWAGMSQIATASEQPPHLKAVAPGMALADPRLDSWAIGGVPSQGFVTGWWMFLHSRWLAVRRSAEVEHDQRCLTQLDANYQSGESAPVNLPGLLIQHPLRDDWIDARTILNKSERIQVPVLSLEAFQDEATTARAGYYQERLNPEKLWYVQTNGNHDLYASLQFRPILINFLEHFVKGVDNGFENRPHVEVWQETASTRQHDTRHTKDELATARWVLRRDHYPVAVDRFELLLSTDHRLLRPGEKSKSTASASSDSYAYPVEGPSVDTDPYKPAWGRLASRWQEGSAFYTSTPLPRDLVIYGPVSADLWVSSTLSDTDIQVTLTEVRSDGQERFVQRGWLRMSNRQQDARFSTPTRPWPCDRASCIQALSPRIPSLARVELTKVSYGFHRGSRIRIWVDAPSATGDNSFDHSSLTSKNAVWHDAEHVSKVVLGVLSGVKIPVKQTPCEGVLMQPCRQDPIGRVRLSEP